MCTWPPRPPVALGPELPPVPPMTTPSIRRSGACNTRSLPAPPIRVQFFRLGLPAKAGAPWPPRSSPFTWMLTGLRSTTSNPSPGDPAPGSLSASRTKSRPSIRIRPLQSISRSSPTQMVCPCGTTNESHSIHPESSAGPDRTADESPLAAKGDPSRDPSRDPKHPNNIHTFMCSSSFCCAYRHAQARPEPGTGGTSATIAPGTLKDLISCLGLHAPMVKLLTRPLTNFPPHVSKACP